MGLKKKAINPEVLSKQIKNVDKDIAFLKKRKKTFSDKLDYLTSSPTSYQFIEKTNHTIDLLAVKLLPENIRFVKNQTEEMCWIALKYHYTFLEFIKKQTPEMCLYALKKSKSMFESVRICQNTTYEETLRELKYLNNKKIIFKKIKSTITK